MNIIDTIAQALWKSSPGTPSWDMAGPVTKEHYRRMAQAAVDTLAARTDVRWCSYCDGTGIVPGSEGQTWVKGIGWTVQS